MKLKITAIFNLAFMLSVNLAPLMGSDLCLTSNIDDQNMSCCEMAGSSACTMSFHECKETPMIPLITAPILKITVQADFVACSLPISVEYTPQERNFFATLIHYILPQPPPSYSSPLLI
ncbi:MAG: hypothetical protein GXO90_06695 [FCB group bacterium]|nr:hypothetical protein [FCB group bacterium]